MSLKATRLLADGHPQTGMAPSKLINLSSFTTADTSETIHEFFETDDGSVSAGVWECAPCREEIKRYPVHELMTVLSGSVTITNDDGSAETFNAGDTFFMPKGTRCTWEVTETLRKFFMSAG
jgi:uncharacterized cupin superfamily protein